MYFLADLRVPCEVCGGDRFKPEVLEVRYRGANIKEVLDMTVDEAFEHFAERAEVHARAAPAAARRPGLPAARPAAPTSSRAARRSGSRSPASCPSAAPGPTLYVLDEPTVGLHWADVQRLLETLDDLTGARRHGAASSSTTWT